MSPALAIQVTAHLEMAFPQFVDEVLLELPAGGQGATSGFCLFQCATDNLKRLLKNYDKNPISPIRDSILLQCTKIYQEEFFFKKNEQHVDDKLRRLQFFRECTVFTEGKLFC